MYQPSTNKLVSTNQRANERYSRSSFTKFNHPVINRKQGDQMQFSLEKRLENGKWIHPAHHTSLWIAL